MGASYSAQSELYTITHPRVVNTSIPDRNINGYITVVPVPVNDSPGAKYNIFCRFTRLLHPKCPLLGAICHRCRKKRHFARVCHAKLSTATGTK